MKGNNTDAIVFELSTDLYTVQENIKKYLKKCYEDKEFVIMSTGLYPEKIIINIYEELLAESKNNCDNETLIMVKDRGFTFNVKKEDLDESVGDR